ncbi:MAG: glycoside hydrolase family 16 protein, partial [Acidimicrobiia bacterium]|nr:glycoside hydrolase family 16 protein [Acidimicrobiia bacterium]
TTTSSTAAEPSATADDGIDDGDDPARITGTGAEDGGSPTTVSTPDVVAGPTTTGGGDHGTTTHLDRRLQTVYHENFAAGDVDPIDWLVYHGQGHEGWGWRRRSAVAVVADDDAAGGHVLELTAEMGSGADAGSVVSGGLKLRDRSLTYGRVSFRARVDPDPDQATAGVVHLWPADDNWPENGEINILSTRDNRDTRTPVRSDLHWLDEEGYGQVGVDHGTSAGPTSATGWHVYTLYWTPTVVSVAVDGGDPVVISTNAVHIPDGPLDLAIQLDASDRPDLPGIQPQLSGRVRMQVDWIRIERFVDQDS